MLDRATRPGSAPVAPGPRRGTPPGSAPPAVVAARPRTETASSIEARRTPPRRQRRRAICCRVGRAPGGEAGDGIAGPGRHASVVATVIDCTSACAPSTRAARRRTRCGSASWSGSRPRDRSAPPRRCSTRSNNERRSDRLPAGTSVVARPTRAATAAPGTGGRAKVVDGTRAARAAGARTPAGRQGGRHVEVRRRAAVGAAAAIPGRVRASGDAIQTLVRDSDLPSQRCSPNANPLSVTKSTTVSSASPRRGEGASIVRSAVDREQGLAARAARPAAAPRACASTAAARGAKRACRGRRCARSATGSRAGIRAARRQSPGAACTGACGAGGARYRKNGRSGGAPREPIGGVAQGRRCT